MANIHGFGDYNNQNPNQYINQQPQMAPPQMDPESREAAQVFGVVTGQGSNYSKRPREYHVGDFWVSTFCPNFHPYKFPFVIWMVITLVYIATLISLPFVPNAGQLYATQFLGADPKYLNTLQAMNPYEVRFNYQLWRPITSLFLTSGLYNYGYASAYLLIFGFMLQVTKIKFLTMLSFYIICGFVGNIFGALCNPNGSISVGSDPANFGIFSGLIATFIVNWKALDNAPQVRCPLIFVLVMITLMLLLGSLNKTALLASYHPYEVYAAWGGYICGFFLGLIMMPHLRRNAHHVGSYEKFIQKVGAVWLVIYLAIVFSCFFTVYNPPKWY